MPCASLVTVGKVRPPFPVREASASANELGVFLDRIGVMLPESWPPLLHRAIDELPDALASHDVLTKFRQIPGGFHGSHQ